MLLPTVTIRPGLPEDTGAVCSLFAAQLLRDPDPAAVERELADAPSALAFDGARLYGKRAAENRARKALAAAASPEGPHA